MMRLDKGAPKTSSVIRREIPLRLWGMMIVMFEREGGTDLTANDVKASNCSAYECFARMSSAREPVKITSRGDVVTVLLTMLPVTWKAVTEILRRKDAAGTGVAFD